ncbi:MAG: serine protein kinase PrkA, partial [Myxococcota bacterium]
ASVDANRGILEYSDLLKRPLEAFKYLLSTCETGRVSLDSVMLYLDIVMLGTANEQNLDRFKEISEFTSFKSRIELIRVPYLLRYDVEKSIYDEHLKESNLPKYIGPHFTELAALWAVMTRLRRPNPERLPEEIRELVGPLTPLEKAKLYNNSEVPKRYNTDQAKILRKHIKDLIEETRNDTHYEGRIGASPREIKTLLLSAAQNERYPSATPLALFEEMEELIQDRSVYQFLQLETQNGYYDPKKFIEDLRELHLEIIDNEFRRASSLVQPNQFQRQFDRYIEHIKAYLRKEKILNPNTRKPEEADERLMQEVEAQIMSSEEQAEQFRNAIISKVAATSLENPGQKVDIHRLFQAYIDTLEYNFFTNNQKKLKRLAQHMLILIVDKKHNLSDNDKKDAEATLNALRNRFQYSDHCIKEIASLLIRKRYNAIEA